MTISKERIKEVATTLGTHYIDKDESFTPARISSLRSRLWQSAKRNGYKVSCSIDGSKFVVTTTQA